MELYSDKSEDELLRMIGAEVSGLPGAASHDDVLVERGRKWLKMKLPQLRTAICGQTAVKSFVNNADEALIATAICDIIANMTLGVSPVTLTSLIMRIGLQRFCKTDGETEE